MNQRHASSPAGFSLVVSLIILTLLAILVTGFLSSTAMDRATAHAFASKAQAEAAANTGANQAMAMLREYITQYPDSATMWESIPTSGATPLGVEGTMLYYNDIPPATSANTAAAVPTRFILPLMSRGVDSNGMLLGPVTVPNKAKAMGTDTWVEAYSAATDANCVDLNRRQSNTDTVGWIGSPPQPANAANPTPRPFRARWIDVKENGNPNGRTVGRYAFWMEDESFKLNLNSLDNNLVKKNPTGDTLPEDTSTGRNNEDTGTASEQSRLHISDPLLPQSAAQQWAGMTPIYGYLRNLKTIPQLADQKTITDKIKLERDAFLGKRLPDLGSFEQLGVTLSNGTPVDIGGDKAKFIATVNSGGLNLSRQGSQRLNLNSPKLGFNRDVADTSFADADIKLGLDRLVSSIRYHAPRFGQRFYRNISAPSDTSAATLNASVGEARGVSAQHENIYLYKIAANIRDYIDPDSQPTMFYRLNGGDTPTMNMPPLGSEITQMRQAPRVALPSGDGGLNEVMAQGKDAAPFLQEAVARYRVRVNGSNWELKIDYYVEFWNMSDRNIYTGEVPATDPTGVSIGVANIKRPDGSVIKRQLNPTLKIVNQMGWSASTGQMTVTSRSPGTLGNPVEEADRTMTLSLAAPQPGQPATIWNMGGGCPNGVMFKAGAFTVITSDPDYRVKTTSVTPSNAVFTGSGYNTSNIYFCSAHLTPKSNRYYAGTLTGANASVRPNFRDGTQDYQIEAVLSNDLGYLEFQAAPFAHGGSAQPTPSGSTEYEFWYGGTLFGNSSGTATPSELSDPRTNNEQIEFIRFNGSTAEPDQSRYWNTTSAPRFTLGYPNVGGGGVLYQNPHLSGGTWPGPTYPGNSPFPWPDYYRGWNSDVMATGENPTAATAPAHIANAPLSSIGQLGDVFDPARFRGTKGSTKVEMSRGGGRTFRIGQHDGLVDFTTNNAASRNWAAWRLADFLSVTDELQLPGLININGVQRDNGAALRAMCYKMKLKPTTRGAAGGGTNPDRDLESDESVTTAGISKVIEALINTDTGKGPLGRMVKNDPAKTGYSVTTPYFGPFMERGEISELDLFSNGTNLLAGVNMAQAFDRGREELVRRLMEMITTRGNIFTVYVMAEAINEGPAPKKTKTVTASHRMKVTFQLIPKRDAQGNDFRVTDEGFDIIAAKVQERFAKPHHYDVQILRIDS